MPDNNDRQYQSILSLLQNMNYGNGQRGFGNTLNNPGGFGNSPGVAQNLALPSMGQGFGGSTLGSSPKYPGSFNNSPPPMMPPPSPLAQNGNNQFGGGAPQAPVAVSNILPPQAQQAQQAPTAPAQAPPPAFAPAPLIPPAPMQPVAPPPVMAAPVAAPTPIAAPAPPVQTLPAPTPAPVPIWEMETLPGEIPDWEASNRPMPPPGGIDPGFSRTLEDRPSFSPSDIEEILGRLREQNSPMPPSDSEADRETRIRAAHQERLRRNEEMLQRNGGAQTMDIAPWRDDPNYDPVAAANRDRDRNQNGPVLPPEISRGDLPRPGPPPGWMPDNPPGDIDPGFSMTPGDGRYSFGGVNHQTPADHREYNDRMRRPMPRPMPEALPIQRLPARINPERPSPMPAPRLPNNIQRLPARIDPGFEMRPRDQMSMPMPPQDIDPGFSRSPVDRGRFSRGLAQGLLGRINTNRQPLRRSR